MLGKPNAKVRPYSLGLVPQSSVYGSTIPVIMGCARSDLKLIWTANLRETESVGKKGAKKGDTASYAANVDFLLGHNPIRALMQWWKNKDEKYTLEFDVHSEAITPGGADEITIPDSDFYMLLGVTLTVAYNEDFDDYGAQGAVNLSGSHEIPLWNEAMVGPDRINMSGWRHYPYVYHWVFGTAPTIRLDVNALGLLPAGTIKLYYAKVAGPANILAYITRQKHITFGETPLGMLNLTFEAQLGTGPEYFGFESFIIVYPTYAGVGSADYGLGPSQTLPNVAVELMGAHSVYSRGDADFVDMIEDIFKGVAQSSVHEGANWPAYADIHHGLNCYEYPGAIQKILRHSADPFTDVTLPLQTSIPGSILVAIARNDNGAPLTISSDPAQTWVEQFAGTPNNFQVWTCAYPTTHDFVTVTIDPDGDNTDLQLLEMQGVDAFTVEEEHGTGGPISASIDVISEPGRPIYLMAIVIADEGATMTHPTRPPIHWKNLMVGKGRTFSMYRIVRNPGTYTFALSGAVSGDWHLLYMAFICTEEPVDPRGLGEILDIDSLELIRQQCRANGLWGSITMDSQRKGSEYLDELAQAANAAPVWMGFNLKFAPWSEVSIVGNGAIYEAPTAAGPIAHLVERDFIGGGDEPMIRVERKSQVDSANLLQVQHPNRDSDYNEAIIAEPEAAAIALQGVRKESPKMFRAIQDSGIARKLLGVRSRRTNYIRNVYKFTLQARWRLLSPMDLVTLTDPQIGLDHVPVRITMIRESADRKLECEAEPFVYGVHAPIGVQAD